MTDDLRLINMLRSKAAVKAAAIIRAGLDDSLAALTASGMVWAVADGLYALHPSVS